MDSSLSEILRHLLQHVRILDGLKKDVSANKDQIETQQLKSQEQELDITKNKDEIWCFQSKIMALQQDVERYQRAMNIQQEEAVRYQRAMNIQQEEAVRQSQTIHRQDKTLQRIDGTVEQIVKITMENSDEICRIKQKEDDTTGMCWS
jgi:multidrug resistance efflux pump